MAISKHPSVQPHRIGEGASEDEEYLFGEYQGSKLNR